MLSVSDAELAQWLGQFIWPFLRILALFAAAPAFNSVAIPMRAKVALAFVITIAVAGTVKQSAPLDLSWATAVLAVEQILVGLAIGFAMQLTLAAMGLAGEFVGIQMGFGFASLFDVQSGFQVPVMANFFSLVSLLLFFSLNGHLVLLGVLVKSFTVVPIAAGSGITADGWRSLARAGAVLFQMGIWLALPVIAVLLAAHLAVGFASRVAPQFNVMSVGFSVFMWVGIAAVIALIPFFVPAVEHVIAAGLTLASAVLRGRAVSDTHGAESRTEQATPRRLQKAREEGSVVRAHAVAGAAVLVAGSAFVVIAGAQLGTLLESSLRLGLALDPETMREPSKLFAAAAQIARPGLLIVAPLMLLVAGVGFVADLLIGGWVVSTRPIVPDFTRIDPMKGFGRLFSRAAAAEIVKALVKFVVIGGIAFWLLRSWLADFLHIAAETWPHAPHHVATLSGDVLLILAGALAVVTTLEVPYQLWQHRDQLKMSRQDIRDEQRDQEGSPHTRRRIRALRVKLARGRMMSEVPTADVVVVNPEHFAAALAYREDRMRAPRLVAKGTGLIALRVRAVAEEHGVPVIEAPPLARSINRFVDLGDEIPVGLYGAVAEILAYVYRLKAAREANAPSPPPPQDGRFEPPAEFDV